MKKRKYDPLKTAASALLGQTVDQREAHVATSEMACSRCGRVIEPRDWFTRAGSRAGQREPVCHICWPITLA